MATIDDFGGDGQPLSNPPLGGPDGWAAAVRDAINSAGGTWGWQDFWGPLGDVSPSGWEVQAPEPAGTRLPVNLQVTNEVIDGESAVRIRYGPDNHDPVNDKICSYFNLRAIPAQPITLPNLVTPEAAANCRYGMRYRMSGSQIIGGFFTYPTLYAAVYARPNDILTYYTNHGYAVALWPADTVGWVDYPIAYSGTAIDGEPDPPTDWEFLIRVETGIGSAGVATVALNAVDCAISNMRHALFMSSSAAP
jgi:hypothetical protein